MWCIVLLIEIIVNFYESASNTVDRKHNLMFVDGMG